LKFKFSSCSQTFAHVGENVGYQGSSSPEPAEGLAPC
jgi:hypothetical protein